jgi:GT2 family glycosyltransferase
MSYSPLWVVTLNWNLAQDTLACVRSVLAAGVPPEQIAVVDNASTDDSVEVLRAHLQPGVQVVRNRENRGYGGGMNAGIRHSLERGAGSVLLLNNDTIVDSLLVEELLAAADRVAEPAILGPAIFYDDAPERLWRLGDVRHTWLPMPTQVRPDVAALHESDLIRVDYVTGCGLLVHSAVLRHIGLFDERYFMYFEDADLCARALEAGVPVWGVPRARMWHKVSLSANRDRPSSRYHRAMNQVRFYHEHPHGRIAFLREVYIALKVLAQAVEDLWRRDWSMLQPLLAGTRAGYQEWLGRR